MAKSDLIEMLKQSCSTPMGARKSKKATMEKVAPEKKASAPMTKDEALAKAAALSVMIKAKVNDTAEKSASLKQIIKSAGISASLDAILKYVEG